MNDRWPEGTRYVRFVGDPRGYVVRPEFLPPDGQRPTAFVPAEIGYTGKVVHIDLAQAYLVADEEGWA